MSKQVLFLGTQKEEDIYHEKTLKSRLHIGILIKGHS